MKKTTEGAIHPNQGEAVFGLAPRLGEKGGREERLFSLDFMCGAAVPFALGRRLVEGRPGPGYWRHVKSTADAMRERAAGLILKYGDKSRGAAR